MKSIKLLLGLFAVGLFSVASAQLAQADTCTAPRVPWAMDEADTEDVCPSAPGWAKSAGFVDSGGDKYLCLSVSDEGLSYADAFGYNQFGNRVVLCNPVYAGESYVCDGTNCNTAVQNDAFIAW